MIKYVKSIVLFLFVTMLSACNNSGLSKQPSAPVKLPSQGGTRSSRSEIRVPFEDRGNVKVITVKLNGVSMEMIFDTGCSGMHLSLHELETLYKQGRFSEADCIGNTVSQIADGSIVQNGLVVLRSVYIGGDNGIEINDIEASVALNQDAPILLGNNVLDEFASYTIDNENQYIIFKKK